MMRICQFILFYSQGRMAQIISVSHILFVYSIDRVWFLYIPEIKKTQSFPGFLNTITNVIHPHPDYIREFPLKNPIIFEY